VVEKVMGRLKREGLFHFGKWTEQHLEEEASVPKLILVSYKKKKKKRSPT